MIVASLIGFAAVFVLIAWTVSATLALVVLLGRRRLRRAGPAFERRAVAMAAMVPVGVAVAVVVALLWQPGVGDHCPDHTHHAHLCLAHGAAWLDRPWAVVLVAGAAATMLVRLGVVVASIVSTRRAVARLRRVSTAANDVRLVESARSFCFVAGLRRPEVYVSTTAWDALSGGERSAMLAHERAHIRHGDLWRRTALELLGALAAPLATSVLRRAWSSATERLCDARAVEVVGPETVAAALVHVCRAGRPQPALASFPPTAEALAERVRAALTAEPIGEMAARRLATVSLLSMCAFAALALLFAEPLHHALETLLG